MDTFEDNTVTSSADPAAEFLAQEQEELGELGEELGIRGASQINMEGLSLEDRQVQLHLRISCHVQDS